MPPLVTSDGAPHTSPDAQVTVVNSGGSIPAGTYWVTILYVNGAGQGNQGDPYGVNFALYFPSGGSSKIHVQSPTGAGAPLATGYYSYVPPRTNGSNVNCELVQDVGFPTPLGTDMDITALPSGKAAAPSSVTPTQGPGGFLTSGHTFELYATGVDAHGNEGLNDGAMVLTLSSGNTLITVPSPPATDDNGGTLVAWYLWGRDDVTGSAIERQQPFGSPTPIGTAYSLGDAAGWLPARAAPAGTNRQGLPYASDTPDPVDTLTGAYLYRHTDLAIAGRGPSPLFRRSCSSLDTRNVAGLSAGWTHNYAINLASPGDGTQDIILMGPDGRSDRYTHNADGSYTPPPAVYTTLVQNADGTFAATLTNQTIWVFSRGGLLTAIKDRYGNQSNLSYNARGQLTFVSDPSLRGSLVFSYNSQGQLTSVSDWLNPVRAVKFSYDANNRLQTVIDRNGFPTVYGYDGTSSRLTTITDANGHLTRTNRIRATHFTELRSAIQDLWTAGGLGTLPNWTVGSAPSTSRQVSARDINDLRSWFNTYQSGHAWTDNPPAVTNTYDSQGRVSTQKDALGFSTGQATSFSYVTNPDGTQTTTVTYPATSYQPGLNPTLAETYDTSGRITTRVTKPSSTETYTESYSYDSNFNRIAVTDARGNTTTFCYDVDYTGATISTSHGNLTRRVDPPPSTGANRPVTLFKYDTKNNLIEMIPPRGVNSGTTVICSTDLSALLNTNYATDYAYDVSGVLLLSVTRKFTDPDLGLQTATTKYEYNDANNPGLVTRIIPPRGNTGPSPDYTYATTMTYYGSGSQAGMLHSSTDADGNQTTYTYDAAGRRLTMVDPNGNVTGGVPADHTWSYTYDAEGRLLTQVAPAPTHGGTALTTTFQYDAVGNRTAVIDANGQVTVYLYDVRDQLTEVHQSPSSWTNPATTPSPLYATQYAYDNLGNLTRVIRAANDPSRNRVTDYLYDGSRHLRQEIQYPSWPLTSTTLTTTYTYDGNGNRTSLVDPLGQTTSFSFDNLNRLTGITYSDGVTPNVTYSYDLNGNRATMVDGTGTTSYSYDELDRLQSVTSPGPSVVGYRYDLDGNRTKLIYPDSTAVTYTFDKASRLTGLSDWASRSTSYTYVPDGHVQQVTNVNGTVTQNSYDNAQRLTQVLNKQSGGTVIDQHTYTLDSIGTRSQVAETLAQIGGGQITPTTSYGYDKLYELTADGSTSYTYDPVGNRATMGSTSYSYDKADRITAAGSTAYTVNANGNVTARGSDAFAYDQANRLKSATVSSTTTTNTFDGDGKRATQKVGSGSTVTYAYDTNRSLPVVLSDGTLKYVWGLGLLYTVDGSANLQVYHADGLGSVRAITDGTATLIDTYQTDAWGNPTATGGSSTQPFRFAGEQLDADGLAYLRARFYEPGTGRFVSRDPILGDPHTPISMSRYPYASNCPVTSSDASGLATSQVLTRDRGNGTLLDERFFDPVAAPLAHTGDELWPLYGPPAPHSGVEPINAAATTGLLAGATAGIVIGAAVAGPIGAAVGGVVGAYAGSVAGLTVSNPTAARNMGLMAAEAYSGAVVGAYVVLQAPALPVVAATFGPEAAAAMVLIGAAVGASSSVLLGINLLNPGPELP